MNWDDLRIILAVGRAGTLAAAARPVWLLTRRHAGRGARIGATIAWLERLFIGTVVHRNGPPGLNCDPDWLATRTGWRPALTWVKAPDATACLSSRRKPGRKPGRKRDGGSDGRTRDLRRHP